ncbi:MAG: Na(+)/drug antiporter, partial [Pseudomonadota bacterium]
MTVDLSERRDLRGLALRLFALAWPVALARLGIMGMGLCDAVVVGRLAPQDLPYQALGWAPTGVMLVSGVGLLTGVQVLAARALGAELPHQAGAALQRGVVVALIGGVLAVLGVNLIGESVYSAFGVAPELVAPSTRIMRVLMLSVPLHLIYIACAMFVEAIAQPLVSTWVMGIANVLNLAVNLWLVPRLGALGSAWATVAARGFLALAMLLWLARLPEAGRLGLALRWRSGGLTTHGYREFFAVGVAAAVSQAAESGAFGGMTI